MAATRNADVNLIVRARTEGEKAIAGLADILEGLFDDARRGSGDIADLGKTIGLLDRAAVSIAGSMDKAGSAVERQRAKIVESNADYQALIRQQAEAQRVQQQLASFVGPRTTDQTSKYAAVTGEVERLTAAISNLFGKITQQNAQLGGTQSALLNLSATSEAVAQGQAEAEARIELTNQALREQAAAAERVSEVQRRIDTLTGVNRPDASGSAARAADILAAADAEFRRLEAVRAEADAQRALNNQLAERAQIEAALERNTGVGRVRASDGGATFSALAERERAAEQAEREAKAERDLADAANSVLAERAQIEAALERNTGLGRTRATDSGATVSALTELVNKEHEAAQAIEQMDREAAQLRATLDPLAEIQERFNTKLARFRELAAAGRIGANELAAAEQHLADEAEKARAALGGGGSNGGAPKLGLFGLKPYELQNLSYQVNDVVTGLASGQHATQIIAQQGGQILQLFPKVAGQIIGAVTDPRLAAFAVTVGLLALGMKRAADEGERLRSSNANLTLSVDGSIYDAGKLERSTQALRSYGAEVGEASAAIKVFTEAGIDPSRLDAFGRAALNLADITGDKLPEAAKKLADGFTGGYEAIAKLDAQYNFLTVTQRESIRQAFEDGRAQEGRAQAFAAFTAKVDEAAKIQRGPAAEASRALSKSYNDLLDSLANTAPVQAAIGLFGQLARAISEATGNTATFATAESRTKRVAELTASISKLESDLRAIEGAAGGRFSNFFADDREDVTRILAQKRSELAQIQDQIRREQANGGGAVTADTARVEKQRADELARLSQEEQLQRLRDSGQSRLLSAAERVQRAELAGQVAAKSASDAVVAAAIKRQAVARETAAIERETEARAKSAKADREREIRQFEGRVIGAEGGAGKNPYSSAKGYGQFTEGTFLNQFGKVFPDRAASLGRDQILALRNNETVARAVIDNYARENARFLESFGAKVTAGNLYLAHFLGAGGAKAVLTAPGGKPVDQIIRRLPNAAGVLSGNQGYLRTEGGKGRYRTASELQAFISNRVGDTGQSQTQGQVEINNLLDDARQKQDQFNLAIQHGNEDRQRTVDALRAEAGLYDGALLAEQRRQAVAAAELDLRQKVEDANKSLKPGEPPVVVTQDQIDKAKELAGALFDVQHARDALNARLGDAQRPVDELIAQRDLLRDQAEFLRSIGEDKQVAAVDEQIRALGGSISDAYDNLIEFYEALSPTERVELGILDQAQLDAVVAKLGQAKQASQEWGKVLGIGGQQVAQAFAGAAASALSSFIARVAAGKNVFKALGQSVQEFAATFISSIAQALVQLLAFAAAVQVLRALGVPVPASFGVGQHHTGGIAGESAGGVRRSVVPGMFGTSMRYHKGGIAGLAPDEVPAILKRGEEVLTQGDPRHRANGGAGVQSSAGPSSFKVVNVNNPADALAEALADEAGQKVLINHVRSNSRAFKAALD